jgi:hypothetical protein
MLLPGRFNAFKRVPLRTWLHHLRELLIIVGAYFLYMYTRALFFDDIEASALANASTIIALEKSLGFFWEPDWQAWAIASAQTVVVFFNWAYIFTFWPIILTAALILYVGNRPRYIYYRNVVLLSFVLALLGFMLFPLAPPRMMASYFVDTINAFGPAFYASREFANYYNPYAAMPSLHFSWTVMFGIVFLRSGNRWVRVPGILYPAVTLLAITITGNHYILDAIGGGILIAGAFAALELGIRCRFFLPKLRTHLRASFGKRRHPIAGAIGPMGAPAVDGLQDAQDGYHDCAGEPSGQQGTLSS